MSRDINAEATVGDITNLDPDDRAFLTELLIRFGAGEHPYPDEQSLDYFRVAYVQQCVARARAEGTGDPARLASLEDRLLAAIS